MSDQTPASGKHSKDSAARLPQRLAPDESVNLAQVAERSRIPLDELEACRIGRARLAPAHRTYPGQEVVRGHPANRAVQTPDVMDRWRELAGNCAQARELRETSERLQDEARRLISDCRDLMAQHAEIMRHEVDALARALRASGAPPERALVLIKHAVERLVSAAPEERQVLLDQVVRRFVEGYYVA